MTERSVDVAIVGGGLAGLTCAHRLLTLDPGRPIAVLEANPVPGGNVGTLDECGYRVELGPNGFLDSKPGMLQLCDSLGIRGELVAASEGSRKNRYVYHHGRLQKLPGGVWDFLTTPLLSVRGKLELLGEPLRRRRRDSGEESVASFARRRLGREAASVFMQSLVTGIHAADWERLSVQAAFPRLAEYERDSGGIVRGLLAAGRQKRKERKASGTATAPRQPTRMWSFPGGLGRLIDALADSLGGVVSCNAAVTQVTPTESGWRVTTAGETIHARAAVLAVPAPQAARLTRPFAPALADEFAGISYSPVNVAAIGYRAADCPLRPDGFGYIAPPSEGRDVLGVQWCSEIFPGRAPAGHVLWRALIGGAKRPELTHLTDAETVELVTRELRAVMRVRGGPTFTRVIRWPQAIPHYTVGQAARERRLRATLAAYRHLYLVGTAVGGVAMNDAALAAWQTATELHGSL